MACHVKIICNLKNVSWIYHANWLGWICRRPDAATVAHNDSRRKFGTFAVRCRGVYGLRLRSSVFGRRACVYSKIFRDIPLVGPNAISKNSNNVVISSPRVFMFSGILVPEDSFPYMWSSDLERFRFGRQGAPKFFFRTRFSRQPL